MSGNKYLFDTCLIIGLYNNSQEAIDLIKEKRLSLNDSFISSINRIEVLGFKKLAPNDEQNLNRLLDEFQILPITREIENRTIDIRKRHKIKLPDAVVLATVLEHHLTLLTLDEHLLKKYQSES